MNDQLAERFLHALYRLEELVVDLVDSLEDLYQDLNDVEDEEQ